MFINALTLAYLFIGDIIHLIVYDSIVGKGSGGRIGLVITTFVGQSFALVWSCINEISIKTGLKCLQNMVVCLIKVALNYKLGHQEDC